MGTIKVHYVKEQAYTSQILEIDEDNILAEMQRLVGGPVEQVRLEYEGEVALVNENGRFVGNASQNFFAKGFAGNAPYLYGDVVFCGIKTVQGEEEGDETEVWTDHPLITNCEEVDAQ